MKRGTKIEIPQKTDAFMNGGPVNLCSFKKSFPLPPSSYCSHSPSCKASPMDKANLKRKRDETGEDLPDFYQQEGNLMPGAMFEFAKTPVLSVCARD